MLEWAAAYRVVELIAVYHQHPFATAGGVNPVAQDLHIEEGAAAQIAAVFIVIAGDIHHPGFARRQFEQFTQYGVVTLGPDKTALHGPEIDHIPHQVDNIGPGFIEKIEQKFCPATLVAQVDVREPDTVETELFQVNGLSHGNASSPRLNQPPVPTGCCRYGLPG